jgi:hypothetical protein
VEFGVVIWREEVPPPPPPPPPPYGHCRDLAKRTGVYVNIDKETQLDWL